MLPHTSAELRPANAGGKFEESSSLKYKTCEVNQTTSQVTAIEEGEQIITSKNQSNTKLFVTGHDAESVACCDMVKQKFNIDSSCIRIRVRYIGQVYPSRDQEWLTKEEFNILNNWIRDKITQPRVILSKPESQRMHDFYFSSYPSAELRASVIMIMDTLIDVNLPTQLFHSLNSLFRNYCIKTLWKDYFRKLEHKLIAEQGFLPTESSWLIHKIWTNYRVPFVKKNKSKTFGIFQNKTFWSELTYEFNVTFSTRMRNVVAIRNKIKGLLNYPPSSFRRQLFHLKKERNCKMILRNVGGQLKPYSGTAPQNEAGSVPAQKALCKETCNVSDQYHNKNRIAANCSGQVNEKRRSPQLNEKQNTSQLQKGSSHDWRRGSYSNDNISANGHQEYLKPTTVKDSSLNQKNASLSEILPLDVESKALMELQIENGNLEDDIKSFILSNDFFSVLSPCKNDGLGFENYKNLPDMGGKQAQMLSTSKLSTPTNMDYDASQVPNLGSEKSLMGPDFVHCQSQSPSKCYKNSASDLQSTDNFQGWSLPAQSGTVHKRKRGGCSHELKYPGISEPDSFARQSKRAHVTKDSDFGLGLKVEKVHDENILNYERLKKRLWTVAEDHGWKKVGDRFFAPGVSQLDPEHQIVGVNCFVKMDDMIAYVESHKPSLFRQVLEESLSKQNVSSPRFRSNDSEVFFVGADRNH